MAEILSTEAQNRVATPEVAPQVSAPNDYQNIQTNPGMFGGLVAQGAEKFGQGLSVAGKFFGQVAADDATNNFMSEAHKLLYGTGQVDPATGQPDTGYYGLRGRAALDARPGVEAKLDSLRTDLRSGLMTPAMQEQFDTDTRRMQFTLSSEIGRFGAQQADVYATEVNKAAYLNQLQAVAARPEDDVFAASAAANALKAQVRLAQVNGTANNPDTLDNIRVQTARDVSEARIKALAPVKPLAALDIFNRDKSFLSGGSNFDGLNNYVVEQVANHYEDVANQNVTLAYNQYQADRSQLPPGAQTRLDAFFTPKIRDAQTRTTADQVLRDFDGQYSAGEKPSALSSAILQQESGNSSAAPASANGAVGPGQILPETFQRYARPGEQITNPEDNRRVSQRIVTDLESKYPGDPARVAVAYFSGEGNVAPPGSPTPYIHDSHDANGKSVSSYVSDVLGRVGRAVIPSAQAQPPAAGAERGPGLYQTQADFYRQNYATILGEARFRAEQQHPDDPHYADEVVARTEQRMSQVIQQQTLAYKADDNLIIQAFNGDFTKGSKPHSITDLTAISPEVKAAWSRMQVNNPIAAANIENRILTANAKGDHDAVTYGDGHLSLLERVWLPPGNPQRITDPTQLYQYVGQAGGITVSGLRDLTQEIKAQQDPVGQVLGAQKANFLKAIEPLIDKSNPLMGSIDQSGKLQFYFFQQAIDRKIADFRAQGKDPALLFNQGSPDFLGSPGALAPFQKSITDSISGYAQTLRNAGATVPPVAPGAPQASIAPAQAPNSGSGAVSITLPPTTPIPPTSGIAPRQPGESPQQYLERIGAH